MIIQHNMVADIANRQYNINNNNSAKNAERLSSGYRVNRAADNAAGLAISEKMRSQVRGLHRASENAWDGISLLRTADGAINESQAIIHRLRELSVQAANDTNTIEDRQNIQDEVDALICEVDRVAFDTEFNTIKLLDGSCEGEVPSNLVSASAVGAADDITWVTVSSNPAAQTGSITSRASAAEQASLTNTLKDSIVPNVTNAILNRFPALNAQANAGNISSGLGLRLYDNAGSNVLASVTIRYGYYSDGTLAPDSFSLGLSVNTSSLSFTNGVLDSSSRTALEATIAHEMMHAFMDDTLTAGMIGASDGKLDASNKFPSWFAEGMAQTLSGAFDPANPWCADYKGKDVSTIQSMVKSPNRMLSRAATNDYGEYSTGYLASMYLGYMASGGTSVDGASIARGINTIFDKMISGDSLSDVIKDISGGKYTSYKDFENKFGDLDSANFIHSLAAAVGTGNGSVLTGDLTQNDLVSDSKGTSTIFVLDVTQAMAPSDAARPWTAGGSGGGGSAAGNLLYLQIGANTEQDMGISIADCRVEALGLTDISVLSHEEATEAIDKCDRALDKLSANRTQIGAYTNRLEYAVKNDDNAGENMQAAESIIRDTDMATEMTQYSKNNILSQASQSMLAQAMSINESVLQLLQ